jgi:hypothetical protein
MDDWSTTFRWHAPGLSAARRGALGAVLAALVVGLERTLADVLVGVYLQGSFALGEADEHSDVDFVVVLQRALREDEAQRLQALHARTYELEDRWAKHLEGSYFAATILADLTRRGDPLWYLDNGARELIPSTHCNTAVVRRTLREHGIRLLGPDPATLLSPVSTKVLRAEILGHIQAWGREILGSPERFENRFYQGLIVLSYCRMWRDSVVGDVGSKRAGAAWAAAQLGPGWTDLIDRAWTTRPDPATSVRTPADASDFVRTLELVHLVMERCPAPQPPEAGSA